jgi:hypothetical protein
VDQEEFFRSAREHLSKMVYADTGK